MTAYDDFTEEQFAGIDPQQYLWDLIAFQHEGVSLLLQASTQSAVLTGELLAALSGLDDVLPDHIKLSLKRFEADLAVALQLFADALELRARFDHQSSPTVAAQVLVTPGAVPPIVGAGVDSPTSARSGPDSPNAGAGATP